MTALTFETRIAASMEVCFDLSRSIDLHLASSEHSRERVVAGRANGLMELNDQVTWRAKHVFWQELTSRITAFDRPKHFTDTMVAGFFKKFTHRHDFIACENFTVMIDAVEFESPWGIAGKVLDGLFTEQQLTRYLQHRNAYLKMAAENPRVAENFLN